MTATRTRTRLSPEARKNQLLATAKAMIVDEGLQRFTMEALARSAGVSSPLVYNYFASRQAVLQDLLMQEYQTYVRKVQVEIQATHSFEEVVRIFINSNFDHYAPGNILPILLSQPEIAEAIKTDKDKYDRQTARFLVQNAAKNYQLSTSQAELMIRMSSGASIAAAEYGNTYDKIAREQVIDIALAYILAGLDEIAKQAD